MKRADFKIENLLDSLPDKRDELLPYVAKVKKYSSECGCSLGGKFLLISIALCLVRFFLVPPLGFASLLKQASIGIPFVFISSIAGKLIGISLAKINLALIHRDLIAKYGLEGE